MLTSWNSVDRVCTVCLGVLASVLKFYFHSWFNTVSQIMLCRALLGFDATIAFSWEQPAAAVQDKH